MLVSKNQPREFEVPSAEDKKTVEINAVKVLLMLSVSISKVSKGLEFGFSWLMSMTDVMDVVAKVL